MTSGTVQGQIEPRTDGDVEHSATGLLDRPLPGTAEQASLDDTDLRVVSIGHGVEDLRDSCVVRTAPRVPSVPGAGVRREGDRSVRKPETVSGVRTPVVV